MLSLQYFTTRGWVPLGLPYELADTQRMQQAAAVLSEGTGAVWRVVGECGRVLTLWDGRRWQAVAEAQPMPVAWWDQRRGDFISTIPAGGMA